MYIGPGEFKNTSPVTSQLVIKIKCFVSFFKAENETTHLNELMNVQSLASLYSMSQKCSFHGSISSFLHDYTYTLAQNKLSSNILQPNVLAYHQHYPHF